MDLGHWRIGLHAYQRFEEPDRFGWTGLSTEDSLRALLRSPQYIVDYNPDAVTCVAVWEKLTATLVLDPRTETLMTVYPPSAWLCRRLEANELAPLNEQFLQDYRTWSVSVRAQRGELPSPRSLCTSPLLVATGTSSKF